RAEIEGEARRARWAAFSLDAGEQTVHRARRRRTERLIEVDGLAELLAHQRKLPGQLLVVFERRVDALGVTTAERPGRVPRQEGLDVPAFVVGRRHHGQPLSIPAALSSSDKRLRA